MIKNPFDEYIKALREISIHEEFTLFKKEFKFFQNKRTKFYYLRKKGCENKKRKAWVEIYWFL